MIIKRIRRSVHIILETFQLNQYEYTLKIFEMALLSNFFFFTNQFVKITKKKIHDNKVYVTYIFKMVKIVNLKVDYHLIIPSYFY